MKIIKKTIKTIKEFFGMFFQNVKIKFLAITYFGSRNFGYVFSKILCFLIFFTPFIVFEIYDFIVNWAYIHFMFIPLIAPIFMMIKMIFDNLGTSLFYLLTLPDILIKT